MHGSSSRATAKGGLTEVENQAAQRPQDERGGGEPRVDDAVSDRVVLPGHGGKGSGREQRVAPQREDHHQQGRGKGAPESTVVNGRGCRGEAGRGRPAVGERPGPMHRETSRSTCTEPTQAGAKDEDVLIGDRRKSENEECRRGGQGHRE